MSGIDLNEEERRLFDLLRSVARGLGDKQVEIRCAGGWVRDKLLGRGSDDIDIALDTMSGEEFANHLNEYLTSHGEQRANVAVIRSNPDQSKHLETAKVKYQGIEIDFVNLRSESYASTSRIPEIEFGTAEEDAVRRDFTINALFYNIGQGNVEDLTGKGLEDLRNKLIRTPLPALQTFTDDPLRVLRAVRFSSRLNFDLHEELVEAASSSEVKAALQTKVSRERISTEFEAMMEGPDPKLALKLIRSFGLLDVILDIPEKMKGELPPGYAEPCISCGILMAHLLAGEGNKSTKRIGILSALLLPLRDFWTEGEKKNKRMCLPEHVVSVSLKKKKVSNLVGCLQKGAGDILSVSGDIRDTSSISQETKVKLGMAIKSTKELWKLAIMVSYVMGLPCGRSLGKEDKSPAVACGDSDGSLEKSLTYATKVEEVAVSLKIDKAWQMKPLVNGKDLINLLNAKGPVIGKAVQEMTKWQLAHPDGSAEDCKEYLLGIRGTL
ncbi:mitochondrial CCA tRNA nucleotidyltransferase [Chloropicon primus]|nr:mitochondrial CCA tRNA nucleotidyltransferase [Chloropicon primus]